jgi:hypothetical protein
MKPGLCLLLCVLLFLSILIAGCEEPDDNWKTLTPAVTPVPTSASEEGWTAVSLLDLQASEESREALNRAANDVLEGNTGWLFDALPPDLQDELGEPPVISSEDAEEIATALSNAREVEMHEGLIIYETTYWGKTHSFYTVREWEEWIIVGF